MSIRLKIVSEFENFAKEHKKTLPPLTDDLVLLDSGIDSLGFAVIVSRLEESVGVDPFSTSEETDFPVTFGDFVKLYENAAR
jgi:acyl carrier protein